MAKINSKGIVLNKKGLNTAIKAHDVGEAKFRELGFTDYNPTTWCLFKTVDKGITFDIAINKKDVTKLSIDVLYEDFLQPYDYQKMLDKDENNFRANKVHTEVQKIMKNLMEAGVISGYTMGDYIWH